MGAGHPTWLGDAKSPNLNVGWVWIRSTAAILWKIFWRVGWVRCAWLVSVFSLLLFYCIQDYFSICWFCYILHTAMHLFAWIVLLFGCLFADAFAVGSHILRKTLVSWQYGAMDTLENMRVLPWLGSFFLFSQATVIITCFGLMDWKTIWHASTII